MAKKNSGLSASQKYWEKRRALEDQYRLIQENATLKKLTDDILPSALKEIQKQLAAQADLHDITLAELLEDYSKRDQKKYREQVEKNYKELMNSDEKYQEFIDEFFPDYDYAKINRLLQIRTDIFDILAREMISKDANKVFNDRLEDILKRTYSSNSNALARIINVNIPNRLSQSELDNILNYPWSGKTFSNRLWGNVSKLEQNLSSAIVRSVSSGQGVLDALKTMREDPEICDMFKKESSKYKKAIENLVRTEYASFAQQGIAKSYEAAGVEEYDVLTSEDEKVCSICGGIEKGNPYKLKDAVIGVNRGPFHGRCRCTDIPHIPDLPASIDKEYEAMFGDLLDEFANDQFGVKLTHPKAEKSRGSSSAIKLSDSIAPALTKEQAKAYEDAINGAPEDVKKMWKNWQSELKLRTANAPNSSYNASGVDMAVAKDLKGTSYAAPKSTFFHEFTHHIDFKAANTKDISSFTELTKLSNGKTFGEVIYKDVQDRIKAVKKEFGYDKIETYKHIQGELQKIVDKDPRLGASLSDLYGGSTNNQLKAGYGHPTSYWKPKKFGGKNVTDPKTHRNARLGQEGFAEFVAATVTDQEQLELMKKWLPNSYKSFEELLKLLGG